MSRVIGREGLVMLQDVRYALRLMAKEPWLSAAVITALALGIGVNGAGFTLVNGVLLRERTLRDSRQIFALSWNGPTARHDAFSNPDFEDWRTGSRSFGRLAGVLEQTLNISDDHALPEQIYGARVTEDTFSVFELKPILGRVFTAEDRRNDAAPVAIIGYRVWRNRYGGDANVLGMPLRVNGSTAAIVGVMPPGIRFPNNAEVWLPFIPTSAQQDRAVRQLLVFGRLAPGASLRQAEQEAAILAQAIIAAHPKEMKGISTVFVESVPDRFVGVEARTMFLTMMAAVTFVLLIACANVANLLLARSAHRVREITMRMALGATRLRVVRQLLIESVVLGVVGGVLGLVVAYTGVRLFDAAVLDNTRPFWIDFAIDPVVLLYVAAVCVVAAVAASLAPALFISRRNSSDVLKDGGRGTVGGIRSRRFSGALVVAQLSLTLVLLAGAGLMVRSFYNLRAVDNGFNPEHILAMRLQLPVAKYPTIESRRGFYERLEERVRAVPGIEAVALTNAVPPLNNEERRIEVEGTPLTGDPPQVSVVRIGFRFFDVLDRKIVRGRALAPADAAAGSPGVLINERLARLFFEGQDPIGRRLRFVQRQPDPKQPLPPWRTIVGISPPVRHGSPEDVLSDAVVYVPYPYEPPLGIRLMVRTHMSPTSIVDDVRRAVQAVDRDQPIFMVQTIQELLGERQWPYSAFGGAFAVFALVALVLASVGLYGLLAYSITQRTPEIGVRLALGARPADVAWLFLRRGLFQLAGGLVFGFAGALALGGVLRSSLVGVSRADPLVLMGTAVVLTAVAITACLLPIRRAAKVDPAIALRRGESM